MSGELGLGAETPGRRERQGREEALALVMRDPVERTCRDSCRLSEGTQAPANTGPRPGFQWALPPPGLGTLL